jgi:hypothetical protein
MMFGSVLCTMTAKLELNSIKRGGQNSCRLVAKISYDLRSSERLFCDDVFVRCAF